MLRTVASPPFGAVAPETAMTITSNPSSRRGRILRPLLFAVAALVASCPAEPPSQARNVVLISIDTLRADHLKSYGYERDTSPALDTLAAGGVRFADVTASSPWTLPSHISLLTGLYPNHHGVRDVVHTLKNEVPTLAGILQEEGWRTRAVVNSINVAARYGFDHGFDSFEHVSEWQNPGNPAAGTRNAGSEIIDRAIVHLDEASDDPLFLFLHFYDVHTDFTPAERYREEFVRPYSGTLQGRTAELVELRARRVALSADDLRFLRDLYDAEIRELDDQLARLFRHLKEKGLDDSTLVVVTSDHGEEFFEHGSLLHGRTHFKELLSIPLLIKGPGVPIGKSYPDPCALVDVTPTILGLLGVDEPDVVDGVNLGLLWRNPSALPEKRFVFSEADHNNAQPDIGRSVRIDRHKLILNRMNGKSVLFDLEIDPGETRDQSAAKPRIAEALQATLEAFMAGQLRGGTIDDPDEDLAAKLRAAGY